MIAFGVETGREAADRLRARTAAVWIKVVESVVDGVVDVELPIDESRSVTAFWWPALAATPATRRRRSREGWGSCLPHASVCSSAVSA